MLPPRPYHIDRKKNKKYCENRRGNWRDYHVKFPLNFLVAGTQYCLSSGHILRFTPTNLSGPSLVNCSTLAKLLKLPGLLRLDWVNRWLQPIRRLAKGRFAAIADLAKKQSPDH
jgi:hypothetical protein